MAILRVNLRSEPRRRAAKHHDNDVGRGLDQAPVVGEENSRQVNPQSINSHRVHVQASGNTNGTDNGETPVWQQFDWRLMPYTPVGRAIVSATQRLEDGGSSTANLDAQVLLAHILGVDRSWLFAHHEYELMPAEANRYSELVARRTASEPVAYLIGRKEFYGIELAVDRRVLIPRPETELIVDAVLDNIESRSDRCVTVADVGTGSGAIALAIAANSPDARIYATDVSRDALAVARANVAQHDQSHQVTLLQGDLLAPLPESVDIIAANLPYIRSEAYSSLQRDVRDYEPQLALEAGPQGLDLIERLLRQASAFLKPNGLLFLEIGHDQGEAMLELVGRLLPDVRYVAVRQDYHGHDRMLLAAL